MASGITKHLVFQAFATIVLAGFVAAALGEALAPSIALFMTLAAVLSALFFREQLRQESTKFFDDSYGDIGILALQLIMHNVSASMSGQFVLITSNISSTGTYLRFVPTFTSFCKACP